jgi:hypothetical protein
MDELQFFGIYCDDIRHEVSGKTSLVGCYGPTLFVRKFPTSLPKLCFHFTIYAALETQLDKAKITMTQNDNVIFEVDGKINIPENSYIEDIDTTVSITGGFDMSPFLIEEPSILIPKILINGHEQLGPKLKLRLFESSPNDS